MRTTYVLPPSLRGDLDRFLLETERFRAGKTTAAEYRAFRVPQGVYEQRQDGAYMLRVRLPGGVLLPEQMRALADVSRRHGSGLLHVTTRQDIQVHDVPLESVHPALEDLFRAGLSTKGGGGNTVRNITGCPHAGVCPAEAFDVTPHVAALTEFMMPDPVSFKLPRKYKIAFSGCSADCAGAMVNDLGLVARLKDGRAGFAAYVAGGMGSQSRIGELLEEFVPADRVHLVAEAVKRLFDKHGNRRDKNRARLRFLIRQLGGERFRELYAEELEVLRRERPPAPGLRELPEPPPRGAEFPDAAASADFAAWRQACVRPQKQKGFFSVALVLFLGDVGAGTMEGLADVVEEHGEGQLRATQEQNLLLRWVSEAELPVLHERLAGLGLGGSPPRILRRAVACTGAATCRLGICLSRGLTAAIRDELERSGPDVSEADVRLHVNGCPNSCGRHPIGSIALVGAARRVGDRLVPHYLVQLGGRLGAERARLAQGKDAVPARSVPRFVVELLRAFRESEHYPDFDAFLDSGGREAAAELAAGHREVPAFTEDRNFYYDWGAEELFSLAGRGPGECSAGVFDLIEVDLASAREALDDGRVRAAVRAAARALLVTRGEEAREGAEALRLFGKHFVETGLVEERFGGLLESAATGDDELVAARDEAAELVTAVEALYAGMDSSLRFKPAGEGAASGPEAPASGEGVRPDREADFQGVTCPLNYVKTKLLLEGMENGRVLAVLLDEAGGKNVPKSAEADGHEVLSVEQEGERWRVIIRKG
ncbi:MAG: sulfurtransferase TusA family protein [Planctomycetota bacterium]|jgi:sulfite reductase (ferredoxin)